MDCWSSSLTVDEEFEKLVIRMNPPRVTVDNATSRKATLIKVDSANKRGSLLEVVQVLTDLDLLIRRAYISSDGEWFMDVFHVTDQHGNKLSEVDVAEKIQQQLGPRSYSFQSLKRSVGVQAASKQTIIELTGRDRPGLLSEIFAVLTDLKCNVVAAEVWTHNSRMASVVYIADETTGLSIDNPERLMKIKQLLLYVLKGDRDKMNANTAVSLGSMHKERRLHQMMYADRDYDMSDANSGSTSDRSKPQVTVENCEHKGYTVVNLRCPDRPKLLFDTVCTLTDMQYVVYHATVIAEGPEAYQEYYIRHMDGCPISSEAEQQRVIHCLEAAIKRRASEGIRLELCSDDRVGLLSDVTRIFRENGLSVTRAEVKTRGSQAVNIFYVTDASGDPVKSETIEAVRKEIGLTILHVKDDAYSKSPPQESLIFSLGTLFKSRFLYNQKDKDSTQGEEGTEGNKGQGQVVVQVVEEEEEEYFYESLDRIASSNSCSCSNSTTPSSDSDSDPVTRSSNARHPFPVPKFPMAVSKFDIWISEPASVSERRTRLLREMGLSRDSGLSRSRPGSETELGLGRAMGAGDAGGRGVQLERRSVSSDRLVKKESEEQDRGVEKGSSSCGIVRSKSNGDCNELAVSSSPCLSVCPNSSSILSVGLSFANKNNNTECDRINVAAPNLRTCESNGSTCNKPPTGRSSKSVNGELGSKSFDGGDDAAGNEVDSSEQVCTIKNLDNGKEFVVKEIRDDGMWNKLKEVGTGRQLTMEEFEMCVGHSPIVHELMRRQNVEEGNKDSADLDANGSGGGGDVSKFKKKGSWFKSIKSVASSVTVKGHKERRSSEERDTSSEKGGRRSSSATDDSQDVSFHGPERVRVKQYGKSCKELTALYKSQEIQAHNGSIWSIKFSLDGKYLASAGEDCEIHVWRVVASEKRGELMEKVDDGNLNFLLVANGFPETTMLSPIADHHPEKKRRGRSSLSRKSLSLDPIVVPDTVFALSDKPFCSFQGHSDDVLDLSWSKSQQLLSSSMDKTVRLWDLISKTCLRIFSHSDYVTCIQFNPVDDKYFISGSLDAKVRIWSIPDRKVVDWNDLHEMVTAACYTPDGQGALVGSYKGSCHLYDTSENKLQLKSQINLQNKKKKAHQKKITGFQFAPGSSSEVLITSADSRIRLVDESDLIHKFKGFRNTNSQISASVTTNGKYVVSASEDSYVYVWKQEAESRPSRNKGVTVTYSYEHFHCKDVSVAIPWPGMSDTWGVRDTQLNDQNCFDDTIDEVSTANHPPTPDEEYSGNEGSLSASGCTNSPLHGTISSATNSYFFDRISATWPEEKLLLAARTRSPRISLDYTSGVNPNIPAWGMVIVTAGLRGEIRTYQNFGLPVRI